jgi:hypothetical protein
MKLKYTCELIVEIDDDLYGEPDVDMRPTINLSIAQVYADEYLIKAIELGNVQVKVEAIV